MGSGEVTADALGPWLTVDDMRDVRELPLSLEINCVASVQRAHRPSLRGVLPPTSLTAGKLCSDPEGNFESQRLSWAWSWGPWSQSCPFAGCGSGQITESLSASVSSSTDGEDAGWSKVSQRRQLSRPPFTVGALPQTFCSWVSHCRSVPLICLGLLRGRWRQSPGGPARMLSHLHPLPHPHSYNSLCQPAREVKSGPTASGPHGWAKPRA